MHCEALAGGQPVDRLEEEVEHLWRRARSVLELVVEHADTDLLWATAETQLLTLNACCVSGKTVRPEQMTALLEPLGVVTRLIDAEDGRHVVLAQDGEERLGRRVGASLCKRRRSL